MQLSMRLILLTGNWYLPVLLSTAGTATGSIKNECFISHQIAGGACNAKATLQSNDYGKTYWFEETGTTEMAKTLAKGELQSVPLFGVGTRILLNGRGTEERTWQQSPGDLSMTLVIHLKTIPVQTRLSLCPLRLF